ncbi:oxidoreductase [Mycobacterium sp. ACS1612]|uniref:LLM class flavin-dependent oxidoreductase n=1 Tax=Mycobacterium sp. ACS1612 TaxID=1834117 RepID=UPI0007FCD192|nr:LLM class flavin-dependent oxidoreductase [Mycobacterium sp. ACS1612]OBF26693.1 oxidoreductase [Mycobacterium sp. ACS1612]
MTARIGVVFRPDFRPDTLLETAAATERAGVAELWLWEDCFLQGGIAAAAAALASSETLTVGLGVLPAPLRNVVTTAMEIATLEAMFPGRLRIGIGHGVQDWMRQAGAAVASPLTLMREYVAALSDLLAGRSVTVEGRYVRLTNVQLDWPPRQPIPVLIGGTGPKTLALAGEIAAGVVLDSRYTPATVLDALGHVATGRAGRGTPFSTVLFVACGAEQAAESARPYLDAGVDTLVYQPVGPQTAMAELLDAAGAVAASR